MQCFAGMPWQFLAGVLQDSQAGNSHPITCSLIQPVILTRFPGCPPKHQLSVPTPALEHTKGSERQTADPAHADPWIPSSRAQVASAGLGHSPGTPSQTLSKQGQGRSHPSAFQGFAADPVPSNSPVKKPLSPDSPSPSGSLISQLSTE